MKFRIKYIDNLGYFAQVQSKTLFFWDTWKTIGKHPNDGTGLYDEDHLTYPLETKQEAIDLMKRHLKFNNPSYGVTYIPVDTKDLS